jgi:hypothetical protein
MRCQSSVTERQQDPVEGGGDPFELPRDLLDGGNEVVEPADEVGGHVTARRIGPSLELVLIERSPRLHCS